MTRNLKCPHCNRLFADAGSVRQHVGAKHRGKSAKQYRTNRHQDDEPSIASQMIEAEISRACGEKVDGWLLDMMP
jgi:hypothetical protein